MPSCGPFSLVIQPRVTRADAGQTLVREQPLALGAGPFALLFAVISGVRRLGYRRGWLSAYRATLPVVVVGNLSVGATARPRWWSGWWNNSWPGAGARRGQPRLWRQGAPLPYRLDESSTPAEAGMSPCSSQALRLPVAVAPRRADAVRLLEQSGEVDIIVTDDGLQHYALARDIELVVVDGARRFGNGCLLPMGPLREPTTRLKRVDAIICNGGEPARGEYAMRLVPDTLRRVCDDAPLTAPLGAGGCPGGHRPSPFLRHLDRPWLRVGAERRLRGSPGVRRRRAAGPLRPAPLADDREGCGQVPPFAPDNWWYLPVSAELPDALGRRCCAPWARSPEGDKHQAP